MTAPTSETLLRDQIRECIRGKLLEAWETENPEALSRRLLDDPRSIAASILMWAADPGNDALRKLGDVTTDRRGQSAAWLAAAQALRDEVRYDARTGRRSAALVVATASTPCDTGPVFVITPPGREVDNTRDGLYPAIDPERVW